MKQINVVLEVDEEKIMYVNKQNDLEEAIIQELGWLSDSGISVKSWKFEKEKESILDQPLTVVSHNDVDELDL